MKIEHLLFIDIETVPQVSSFQELSEPMQHVWKKKAGFIDTQKTPEDLYALHAGIYAEFGKIVCIGVGFFYEENNLLQLRVKTISSHHETEILKQFTELCSSFFKGSQHFFCGHNIKEFDIPYICRRLLIQGMPLPNILQDLQSKKPWENPMVDTMQLWKFGEYKNFVSVELLSTILNIPSPKDDIDGSDVASVYWQENNLQRIAIYCGKDIVTVAQLYLRLHGKELLSPMQIHFVS